MPETKTVRIDKELMDKLAEEREGFETPNECLKRLLNGHCNANGRTVAEVQDLVS